jgi:molecular chaperone GrpE
VDERDRSSGADAGAEAPAIAAGQEAGRDITEQAEDLPPLDEIEAMRTERDALGAERDGLQDRLLRLAAEFDNYRKRSAREWQEHRQRAAAEVWRAVLELADNLERALQVPAADGAGLRKGVELIHQQLQALLKRFGLEPIEAVGRPFDPQQHDAVLVVEAENVASHHVVDVVQNGYTLHGEVLRPARVTVSR